MPGSPRPITHEETPIDAQHSPAPAIRWGAALALTVLVVGCAALTLAIDAVPPLALAVITTVVLAQRRWVGWRLGLALALLGGLVGQTMVAWLAPQLGWSLTTATVVAWTAVGVGNAALNALPVPPAVRWTRARAVDLLAALLVPAGLGVYFWLSAARSGPWLAWAMANDAAPYALMTRRVLEDGGLLRAQENPAPLAGVLHATWAAPGADGLSPAGLVAHLLSTSAQLSLVGWALLGFLAAVVTLATTRGRSGTRVMVAAAAAALPWTWFIAQIAVNLGFTNAWPAMVVLVLAWCCWQQHAHHPVGSLTGQILATWAAVVSWGPIAVVPAAWLLATVLVERRALRAAGRGLLLPGLTLVAAAAYAVVLTLPDLTRQGGNLAADGAAPAIERWWGLGVAVAVLVASLVPRTGMSRTVRIGIWFGVPAAGLGAAYLIRARAEMPDWWGYYPAKFTWIALSALFLIAVGSLQHPARRLARRGWEGNGVLLVIAVILVVMAQVSQPGRPVTLASMFSPVQLRNPAYNDAAIPDLFELMERDPKSIVARFSPVPGHDYFVNYWMLQMGAEGLDDQIRVDAYFMDSSNPESVCTAIADWRGDVTVWTRDPKLEKQLDRTCDAALDYRVEVRPPLPPPEPPA